jgi:hypothetical protein
MLTFKQYLIENESDTYLRRIDMLEHELFIYLISKRKADGTKYDSKWAQNICTVVFAWPRLVDNWMNNSKDIKKEIKKYNINAADQDSCESGDIADSADSAVTANMVAATVVYAADYTSGYIAVHTGYVKSRSKALIKKLHKVIPSFKYDLYTDIDNLVNQRIQAKLKEQSK